MITLKDMMRTGQVKRWQIVRTLREQTLAEHSYMVTMIADAIFTEIRGNLPEDAGPDDFSDEVRLKMLLYALRHDLAEVMIGDIPTPVKARLRALVEYDPLKAIEGAVDPVTRAMRYDLEATQPIMLQIVKLADLIEPIVFLTHEGSNTHGGMVIDKLYDKLHSEYKAANTNWPFIDWSGICSRIVESMTNGPDGVLSAEVIVS
jgi:5'-deoxynucleotidase